MQNDRGGKQRCIFGAYAFFRGSREKKRLPVLGCEKLSSFAWRKHFLNIFFVLKVARIDYLTNRRIIVVLFD
jgi:hypothetical protein